MYIKMPDACVDHFPVTDIRGQAKNWQTLELVKYT